MTQPGPLVTVQFSSRTKIFEDDNVELYVAKTGFKRQDRFTLDDHLFVVKAHLKNDQPPLLSVMLGALTRAFEFMLNHLKSFYPSGIQKSS